jgi:hypothetical protein
LATSTLEGERPLGLHYDSPRILRSINLLSTWIVFHAQVQDLVHPHPPDLPSAVRLILSTPPLVLRLHGSVEHLPPLPLPHPLCRSRLSLKRLHANGDGHKELRVYTHLQPDQSLVSPMDLRRRTLLPPLLPSGKECAARLFQARFLVPGKGARVTVIFSIWSRDISRVERLTRRRCIPQEGKCSIGVYWERTSKCFRETSFRGVSKYRCSVSSLSSCNSHNTIS